MKIRCKLAALMIFTIIFALAPMNLKGVYAGIEGGEVDEKEKVITARRAYITGEFDTSASGQYRYKIYDKTQRTYATVGASTGLLTCKKSGIVDVNLEKKEGSTWISAGQKVTFNIVVPKGKTVPYGVLYYRDQPINLNDYISDSDLYPPDYWDAGKTKDTVASIDRETDILTAGSKNGIANVYAVYGSGEKNPRKVKVSVKINHKKVDINIPEYFDTSGLGRFRYKITDTGQRKFATVSTKGLLYVKKEGRVKVTLQEYTGGTWKEADNKYFDVKLEEGGAVVEQADTE